MSSLISNIFNALYFVFSANIAVKLLSIIQTIILMRILTPYEFGVVAISMSLILIFQRFQTIGISEAIIVKSGKNVSEQELGTLFTLRFGISCFLYLIAFIIAPLFADIYSNFDLINIVRFIALLFLVRSFGIVSLTLLKINIDFKTIAKRDIIEKLFSTIITITLAYGGFSYWSILIGRLTGAIIGTIYIIIAMPWKFSFHFNYNIFKRLLGFGKWILFTSIIFTFVSTIDTFIIGKKLSLVELGFYAIAARWGYLVLLQLTPALQKVLFPIFSSSNNVSEIKESYLYSLYFLGIISFPISFGMVSVAPEFIDVISGDKWSSAIIPLQILSICGLIRSLNLADPIYISQNRPNYSFYIMMFMFIYLLLFLYPSISYGGIIGASLCITFGYFLNYIYSVFLLKKVSNLNGNDIIKTMVLPLISSLIMSFLVITSKEYLVLLIESKVLSLITLIMIGILSYILFTIILSRGKIINDVKTGFKQLKGV